MRGPKRYVMFGIITRWGIIGSEGTIGQSLADCGLPPSPNLWTRRQLNEPKQRRQTRLSVWRLHSRGRFRGGSVVMSVVHPGAGIRGQGDLGQLCFLGELGLNKGPSHRFGHTLLQLGRGHRHPFDAYSSATLRCNLQATAIRDVENYNTLPRNGIGMCQMWTPASLWAGPLIGSVECPHLHRVARIHRAAAARSSSSTNSEVESIPVGAAGRPGPTPIPRPPSSLAGRRSVTRSPIHQLCVGSMPNRSMARR